MIFTGPCQVQVMEHSAEWFRNQTTAKRDTNFKSNYELIVSIQTTTSQKGKVNISFFHVLQTIVKHLERLTVHLLRSGNGYNVGLQLQEVIYCNPPYDHLVNNTATSLLRPLYSGPSRSSVNYFLIESPPLIRAVIKQLFHWWSD